MNMRPVFAIVGLVVLLFIVYTMGRANSQTPEYWNEMHRQSYADELVREIQYVMDSRTKLCFAYLEHRRADIPVPVFATVPCEVVPTQLLVVVK